MPRQDRVVLLLACRRIVRGSTLQEAPWRDVELHIAAHCTVPRADIGCLRSDLLAKVSWADFGPAALAEHVHCGSGSSRGRSRQVDHPNVVVYRPHRVMGPFADLVGGVGAA